MPIGLLRMCRATNSVAQFIRNIIRIFRDLILEVYRAFLDDICVLLNTKLLGYTITGGKSQFCQKTTVIVGYLCSTYRRAPNNAKGSPDTTGNRSVTLPGLLNPSLSCSKRISSSHKASQSKRQ
ncbi:unnamed protein product [Fusarium fujikuroi]|uniref:Uncharacterized protein n=1 Tax=Fusarium fujikuroi TaxID=5127 RepID=A0A9Q9RVS1_FUSFU|nr:unnamed protein product [Fusarium fujikuroi]VTT76999.1 unnamed protein product [Fusarium fujikuroi]VZH89719.1 unnamed protein product [Fusarium fujikuroi]